MGLIKAAVSSIGSTLGDTWKDYFCCDSMPPDVLVTKGIRKSGKGSSNKKGNENIITTGSVIVVHEGQCVIIVDQGQIVEVCAVPGEYTYDASTEPSVFVGGLNGIKETFKTIGKRFTFGGTAAHDQCIYYFNMHEITGNKFGTSTPVPFRVSYQDLGRPFTVGLRCNGVYSYKIADPLLFYKNVCGNSVNSYTRGQIDDVLYNEFMAQLAPAFAKLSATIRYDELNLNTLAVTNAMKEAMTAEWRELRGIEICSVAIRSVSIPKEDEDKIKQYEDMTWNKDAGNAAAKMLESQAQALRDAANNKNGSAMGFYGMNMTQQMGGLNTQNLYDMAAQQQKADSWNCSCGTVNTAKFCANCGKPKPAPAGSWSCSCGTQNSGKFCANCGNPKPADGWSCSCGAVNKGKFCSECGKPKPAGAPLYKCDKCGWEPEDPMNPPKFCANCGDPFTGDDIVK